MGPEELRPVQAAQCASAVERLPEVLVRTMIAVNCSLRRPCCGSSSPSTSRELSVIATVTSRNCNVSILRSVHAVCLTNANSTHIAHMPQPFCACCVPEQRKQYEQT